MHSLFEYDDVSERFTPLVCTAQTQFYHQTKGLVELFRLMYLTFIPQLIFMSQINVFRNNLQPSQ